jgi:hypothetical protein
MQEFPRRKVGQGPHHSLVASSASRQKVALQRSTPQRKSGPESGSDGEKELM